MLEHVSKLESGAMPPSAATAQKQRRRMFLAIILLLLAVVIVLVRDRHLWSGSGESQDADPQQTDGGTPAKHGSAQTVPATSSAAAKTKRHTAAQKPADQSAEAPAIVASNRTALPPLQVEVVAGDVHRTVRAGSDSVVRVDLHRSPASAGPTGPASNAATDGTASNAAQRVRLSPDTAQAVERQVNPSYPLLARQMKVQGSVAMQALIGADGLIQDLRVLSGPEILASAAREAVRQWHFKPYLQNGKPVETQAKITVNFTISTF